MLLSSLTRMAVCGLTLAFSVGLLGAASPSWWVLSGTANNYAPANLGQLKYMAQQAKSHLDTNLIGGAGTAVSSLVSGFVTGTTPEEIAANYAPLNIGQLKYVAKPFYDRLLTSGYDTKANLIAQGLTGWTHDYPWDPAGQEAQIDENYAPANIGQLKLVFSFDVSGFVSVPDADQDGLPDAWENEFLGGGGYTAGDDPDNDGLSNLTEYLAGNDPTSRDDENSTEFVHTELKVFTPLE